jgi:hypothetical protein
VRCLGTFDGVESLVAQKRSVDQSAGKLKLISKGLDISGEVLLGMFPLSSALSMYPFSTGSITWPALALALGTHLRNAE